MTPSPIYKTRELTKNGKHYHFDEAVIVFDCPDCEYLITTLTREGAETALDVHFFHHHPENHIPIFTAAAKGRIQQDFNRFRMRATSPICDIRPPSS